MSKGLKIALAVVAAVVIVAALLIFWNSPNGNAATLMKPSPTVVEDNDDQGKVPLTAEEQALVDANTVAYVEVSGDPLEPMLLAASGCRNVSKTIASYNNLGVLMWTFTGYASWCWSGGKVTSVSWDQSGRVNNVLGNLWKYDGVSSSVKTGGVGQSYAYRRVTGKFHFCVTWYCQYAYPYASITVRGDGTASTGGSY